MGIIEAILRAKRGTRAYLQTQILKFGEFAYETDYKGLKIGDGNTLYSSLEYLILPRYGVDEKYLKVSNGQLVWSDTTYDDTAIWNELSLKQNIASLDTDVAALDFVKHTVNNLTNYYLKTETYTQAEVNALIGALSTFHYEIYPSISSVTDPQSNVLYLIGPTGSGADKYDEYVYSNNNWVKIGDTSINLSNYITTSDLNTALSTYTTTSDLNTLLTNYQTKIDANNKLDYSLIDNMPILGTAAALDVSATGDAAITEVVKGDDTRLTDARTPTSHTHTSSEITDLSGTNDGTNWTSITIGSNTYAIPSGGGGGLSDYDFTELSAPTISGGAATVTFVANQRNCVEMSNNADLALSIISNNKSDNYIWITNTHGSNSIDVTFSSIKFGSTTITNIKGTSTIPSIDAGETLEIGIYVNNNKARITSRIL